MPLVGALHETRDCIMGRLRDGCDAKTDRALRVS